MEGACYWWRDIVQMDYILSYNYCNLDKVEYSGTDITSTVQLYSTLSKLK
jgi:hypothetical protein